MKQLTTPLPAPAGFHITPPLHPDDEVKFDAVREGHTTDATAEPAFDDLAQLAADLCNTPIALITMAGEGGHWFKSTVGLAVPEVAPMSSSFCAYAMRTTDLLVVPDAQQDERFAGNPMVTGEPHIRFYAGAPLVSPEGRTVGTLCVMDRVARGISTEQQRGLRALGRQVMTHVDLHRRNRELARSNQSLRAIFDTEPECVKLLAGDGSLLDMNPAGLRMIEADSLGQVQHRSVYPLIVNAHRAAFRDLTARGMRGESGALEFQLVGLKGTERWMDTHSTPLRDEDGRITAVLSITRDITERHQAQLALRRAGEERTELINTIDGIVWEADARTLQFTFVSHQAERLLGFPVERWLTDPGFWSNQIHPDDRAWATDYCRRSTTAGCPHEFDYRMIAADGRTVWLHDIVNVVVTNGEPTKLRGLMVDITERRAAEAALRSANERYERQHASLTGLARSRTMQAVDLPAALREITETAARTLGVDRVSVWRFNQARSAIICQDLFEAAEDRHSSGTELTADIYPAYFQAVAESDVVAVPDARQDPRTREFTDSYLTPRGIASMLDAPIQLDGERYGVLCHEHVGSVREWTSDEQAFAVSVANFVSLAIAQFERKQMEGRFRQSQKMEAIGQLAGGVAHDFNNLLTVIQGHASFADDATPAEWKDHAEQIVLASERAASLTRQLLLFSRRQLMQPRQVDLNVIVTNVARMLQRILGEDVHMLLALHPAPLPTLADAGMIDQVLMNLAVNARDAMTNGGHLTIETTERVVGDDEARLVLDTAPGRYVCLRVTDSGCGIPAENLSRVFEPFFTTKEPGKGTGLGLATVFGIVKQHRGTVDVSSEVGARTTFSILLPASITAMAAASDAVPAEKPRSGTETILVVEDERGVRDLIRTVLQRHGYEVLEAASGAEALRIWEQDGARVQLLLTDMVMPEGVSGRELAANLRERKPGLKVVFTSGYSPDLAGLEVRLQEGLNFLPKPYPPLTLLRTIRRRLDEP